MKKFLAILVVMALLLSATACGKSKGDDAGKADVQTGDSVQTEQTAAPVEQDKTEEKIDPENWGLENTYSVLHNDIDAIYRINTPHLYGTNIGRGILCEQMDGTMILISGQRDHNPTVGDISEVFPACQEQVEYTLVKAYGMLAQNFAFTFGESQAVTVGEYDMYTFEGEVTFTDDTDPMDFPFIAYATMLEANGGYAYWVVFDITDDHSAGNLIAEHAYNMALTFREKQ